MSVLSTKRPLDCLGCSSYLPPPKSRRTDVRLYHALDRITPVAREWSSACRPQYSVGSWMVGQKRRRPQSQSQWQCPQPPSAQVHLLPNITPDPKDDVEMADAPPETSTSLDISEANTFAQTLRASTFDIFKGIESGWEYPVISARMKEFIKGAWQLARLPDGYELSCDALIWFSIGVLHRFDSPFVYMLNSQRQSLYWQLDDAVLYIALEWWQNSAQWNVGTLVKNIQLALSTNRVKQWELGSYFAKSLEFLQESQKVYDVRSCVLLVASHRLPPELTDQISGYLLYSKGLPLGDVKMKHDWRSQVSPTRTLASACASSQEFHHRIS